MTRVSHVVHVYDQEHLKLAVLATGASRFLFSVVVICLFF